jgi:hypothetical protein
MSLGPTWLRSMWTFLVTERAGYFRPSPVTAEDRAIRAMAETRIERVLTSAVRLLDADLDLLRLEHEARLRGGS